jgi:hypothetical protein
MEEHSDEDELDLALLRAAKKRAAIPNSLGMAFESSSALLQSIATDKGVDISTDSNLLEVLTKMVQHNDQLASALGLVQEQLASLQHVSSVNDELVAKVFQLEDTCGRSSSNANSLNQKPNLLLYAERLEAELKEEEQRSCDLEARANLLDGGHYRGNELRNGCRPPRLRQTEEEVSSHEAGWGQDKPSPRWLFQGRTR